MSLIKFSFVSKNLGNEMLKVRPLCGNPSNWLKLDKHVFCSIACSAKAFKCKLQLKGHINYPSSFSCADVKTSLIPQKCIFISTRNTTFFTKLTAQQLWKGVTSVSNVGSKRGRGRGGKKIFVKDLNKGQFIGKGERNVLWPGLNAPIIKGKDIVKRQTLPSDENRNVKMIEMRNQMGVFRPMKLNPLERGFSGTKWPGRSIGPPDPIGEDTFEGFDTRVLECKRVCHSTSQGKKSSISMFVVSGNKNGLAGFGLGKATTLSSAMHKSKNKAAQNLLYFDLCEGHTVFHDFHCKFMSTGIYVKIKPKGYGLVCHRVIMEICKLIGIKDLHAKIEGSINIQNMTKAFFLGLLNQRTHQQLADEKGLYVAKLRPGMYPEISAAPSNASLRSREDISLDEEMDFKLYVMGGKVELEQRKFVPFYTRLPSWERHLKKQVKCRNHDKIKKQLLVEHGEVISFLTAQHPECRPGFRIQEEEEEN